MQKVVGRKQRTEKALDNKQNLGGRTGRMKMIKNLFQPKLLCGKVNEYLMEGTYEEASG